MAMKLNQEQLLESQQHSKHNILLSNFWALLCSTATWSFSRATDGKKITEGVPNDLYFAGIQGVSLLK